MDLTSLLAPFPATTNCRPASGDIFEHGPLHGIVLSVTDRGESDKLVMLYTRERGRIRGLAKGARRSRRRFVNKLEEFSLLRLQQRPPRGSGPLLITEAELLEPHLPLRQRHDRFLPAMFLSELIQRFTQEEDSDPRLFTLLRWGLGQISRSAFPPQAAVLFHLRLLDLAGYRPALDSCGRCGAMSGHGPPGGFNPLAGTICCASCAGTPRAPLLPLQMQTLRLLQDGLRLPLPHLARLRFSAGALMESLVLLGTMSRHLLQDELRCLGPLTRMISPDSGSPHRTR